MAIAAHGKRCQQSPFRGSPYCWHHTQSRKIWAPSRPLGAVVPALRTGGPVEPAPESERRTGTDRRARADRRPGWAPEEAAALRLGEALGPARVEELLSLLEGVDDAAYLIVKDENGVFTERSVAEPPARRRSA